MITLTTEQAQQIEEALVNLCNSIQLPTSDVKALSTIRAARAQEQAEQEPVADIVYDEFGPRIILRKSIKELPDGMQLFTAPVRTKDLTPHEITALIREGAADGGWQGFAQRVIAADREKNK